MRAFNRTNRRNGNERAENKFKNTLSYISDYDYAITGDYSLTEYGEVYIRHNDDRKKVKQLAHQIRNSKIFFTGDSYIAIPRDARIILTTKGGILIEDAKGSIFYKGYDEPAYYFNKHDSRIIKNIIQRGDALDLQYHFINKDGSSNTNLYKNSIFEGILVEKATRVLNSHNAKYNKKDLFRLVYYAINESEYGIMEIRIGNEDFLFRINEDGGEIARLFEETIY